MPRRTDISSILIIGARLAPSPRRGEGWGEGARRRRLTTDAVHPHPTLSLKGEGIDLFRPVSRQEQLLSDRFQHAIGVGEDIVVPEAEDPVAVFFDDLGAGGVPLRIMLAPVEFESQSRRSAGEVRDVAIDLELADEILPFESAGAKIIPEALFGFGLVASEAACDRSQALS